jgi:hypothetical protein
LNMSTPNLHSLPDEETAGGVCFVGEQDGLAEGELKRELADLFRAGIGVRKAYLARIIYQGQTVQHAALCLRADLALQSSIVMGVGDIFHRLFSRNSAMDIVFVDDAQEECLTKICRPFFTG